MVERWIPSVYTQKLDADAAIATLDTTPVNFTPPTYIHNNDEIKWLIVMLSLGIIVGVLLTQKRR